MNAPLAEHEDTEIKIVDAAIRCFERYGPQRTSMNDIAEEAGVSRRTLYRVFDDRSALIERLLHRRLAEMGRRVEDHLTTYDDIEEALIEGSLFSVGVAEEDELFSQVVAHEHNRSVERFLLGGNDALNAALVETWSPVLDQGRTAERVHAGLSDERVVEIIANVQTLVLMRDDLNQDARRALLRDILVPAVLRPSRVTPQATLE